MSGHAAHVGHDVDEITAGEFRPGHTGLLHRLLHLRCVFPHFLGPDNRVGIAGPALQVRGSLLEGSFDGVATNTALVAQETLSDCGIARLVEVSHEKQKAEQIAHLFLAELGVFEMLAKHVGMHFGDVIPHDTGQIPGGEVLVFGSAEIGSDLSSQAPDGVALDALFSGKYLPTSHDAVGKQRIGPLT